MPIFEYNGNKVNVNDDQISEFAKYHPDAITKIERDGKVYGVRPGDMDAFNARFTNNQEGEQASQIYYQPQAMENTGNKDTGSFVGDIGERFLSGAASAAGSTFNLLDKGASAINRWTGSEGGFFREASDFMKGLAEYTRRKSDRYQGKGFTDLIKEGDYSGALGSAVLDATESAPLSLGIMATGGTGLVGAGALSASDKYEQLKQENPDMPAFNRYANSILTGAAESLSEVFGAGTLGKVIKSTLKAGGKKAAADLVKKNFLDRLATFESKHWITMPIISEGSEEAANALAEYVVDKATGVKRDDNIFETMINAAVPGAMGGAQFVPFVGAGKARGWNQKRKVTNAYNEASKGIEGLFNEQEKAQFDETIHRFHQSKDRDNMYIFLNNVKWAKGMNDDQTNAMYRYVNASTKYDDYVSYVNDRINEETKRRMDDIDSNLNKDMDAVVEAYINGDTDNPVYVTKGKLYGDYDDDMNPTIDYDKSDDVIYYRDSDGKIQQCDVKNVTSIVNARPRAELYSQIMDEVRGQIINEEESDIDFAPGDDVVLSDGRKGNIQSRMEDGRFTVTLEDGTTVAMPYDQLLKPEAAEAQAERQQQQTEEERINNQAYPMDKKGRIDFAQITDPQMYHDALINEFGDGGIVAAESYMNNSKKDLEDADKKKDPIERLRAIREAQKKVDFFTQVYDMFPQAQTAEQTTENNNAAQQPVDASEENVQPEQTVANNENPSQEEPNITTPYEDRPVDDTVYDLLDGQMDIDEVNQFVDANKKEADKALKEIENNKPAMTTNRDEYLRQKGDWQVMLNEAKRKSEYWDSVKANLQAGSITDAERNQLSALENNAPVNAEELAARAIADGSIKLLRDDFKKETGSSNTEANKMFGIFASEAKGGVSIERAGEILTQMDQEAGTNFFDPTDPNAARNVIIDVLSLARTRGDLISYIRNQRDAQRRREEAAAYNDFAKYTTEAYGMTPEEYQAYEESFQRDFANMPEEAIRDIDGEIYDDIKREQEDYEYVQQQINNNNNDNGGIQERSEGGGSILREEQPVEISTGDRGTEIERRAGQDGYNQDASTPEEAGGEYGRGGQGNPRYDTERESDLEEAGRVDADDNGIPFVRSKEGSTVFGYIDENSGLKHAPIKLSEGRITNEATKDGYGLLHIEAKHGDEIRKEGYASVIDFIEDVAKNYSVIKEGKNRNGSQTYLLQVQDKHNNTLIVELSKHGSFWVVNTAGVFKKSYARNNKEVYNRHTTDKQSAETVEVSQDKEQSGTDLTSSMITPTTSSGKNNITFIDKQEKLENNIRLRYSVNVDKETGVTTLTREDISGAIPVVDASFNVTAKSPEEMLGILSNPQNGMKDILDEVGASLENQIKTRNLDRMTQQPNTESSNNSNQEAENTGETSARIAEAESVVNTNPTDAQKEAGNYKMGHVKVAGFDVTIENPAGSVRSGIDSDGERWENVMNNTYGYFKGTKGVDGDHIDVYLSNDIDGWDGKNVYVIDQYNPDGSFDEHKVMFGFNDKESARRDFLANYDSGWGDSRRLDVTPVSMDDFKKWIDSSHRKTKPFAEYASVKAKGNVSDSGSSYGSKNKIVSNDRYEELKRRMREKLGQLNMGIDPEMLQIGIEMAVYHIEAGATKFADFSKAMIGDLGDKIRPYLKAFYNGARDLPETTESGLDKSMTPYDEVKRFDIVNLGKPNNSVSDVIEGVANERNVEDQVKVINKESKKPAQKQGKKESPQRKKTVTSRSSNEIGLFDNINDKEEVENGLQSIHELRPEGLPTDGIQPEQGLRGVESATGQGAGQESRGSDVEREGYSPDANRDRSEARLLRNQRNNRLERGVYYAPRSVDARIEANIKAIELANELYESGEQATPDQMAVLRRFSGWGGLGKAFQKDNPTSSRLRELLGDEAYDDANLSRNSAYYTPSYIIDSLWDIARSLGFKGGRVLEGSAGIGNIIGAMPKDMSDQSDIQAVEIDQTTGKILSLLYPDANVEIKGFENTKVENGSVDLAITNVPFVTGQRVIDDTGDKDLSRKFRNIHDFCIAKNVRKLREGGIGIFISSNGTLDNSQKLRNWVVNEGKSDFIGAFRLNKKTFGGAGVTSDIIIIRKRVNGVRSSNAIDVSQSNVERVEEYDTGETRKVKGKEERVIKNLPLDYNKYFMEHPENMAGVMRFGFEEKDTYHPTSKGLFPSKDKDQEQMLEDWVKSFAGMSEKMEEMPSEKPSSSAYEKLGKDVKEGSMVLNTAGKLCVASFDNAVPLELNDNKVKGHTKKECFLAYREVKRALSELMDYEANNESDEGLKPLLDKLNRTFDRFVNTYGHLHKNTAISFLKNDIDFQGVLALEKYEEKSDENGKRYSSFEKTDVFRKRVIDHYKDPVFSNVKDGIIASIYKSGRIDVPYIASTLKKSEDEVSKEIINSGLGFEDPISREIEVGYEYLSGNVREKLAKAKEENKDGRYDSNIKALEAKVPMNIPSHLIEFSIGSSWIDSKLYDDFVKEMTGLNVKTINAGGTWDMKAPNFVDTEKNKAMGVRSEICHKIVLGHELIQAAMQNKTITVSETRKDYYSGSTETITDKEATQACSSKIDEIRQQFKDWARERMQVDPDMANKIEGIYNEKFNNYVPKSIPEEFIPEYFPGASKSFTMRPHQAKAIIRGTTQPLLLAHEVGTGKTFTMISIAMEMRRLGTAKKPMIVVQNATTGQFVESAKALYPNAKVLSLSDKDHTLNGRQSFYAKIKYNDWDMIVIPQSVFERIPDSEERRMAFVKDKIDEKMAIIEQMKREEENSFIVKAAEREIEQLNDELASIGDEIETKKKERDAKKDAITKQNASVMAMEMLDREVDDVENFDDMGIDAILVDEAHEYKHLGFATAMQRGVKGVDPSYSKKAQGVYLKAQSVLERNNGKNVIFATGTPISNTAAEIWTFMRYLMPADTMREYDIYYFDDFVRNFGNLQQMLEFTTSGNFKENNRFAGYVNLPELVRIWSSVADTVRTEEAEGVKEKIPDMETGKAQDIYLPQTKALRGIMKYVKEELRKYDNMSGKEKKANSHIPLTMYGIAKAAAVDARLVSEDAADDPNSKTNESVRQTLRALKDSDKYKGTVALFADNYQNKKTGFNLYEDIKKKLVKAGVPADKIVIMRSDMTAKKKLEIFDKVNSGDIRVIMGSTFTLGTGVNIQERLHTLIHIDAPNRPMDYTQRNGRILRQGNIHKDMGIPVRVLRFGVEDSLDVTAYQRLKTKGAIAESIMRGKEMMKNNMENRSLEEDEDVFGDTVAQLSGSEYAMLKSQAEKEVRKLNAKKKQWEADQIYIHNAIPSMEGKIKEAEERVRLNEDRLSKIKGNDGKIKVNGVTYDSVDDMTEFFKTHNKKLKEDETKIRERGTNDEIVRDLSMNIGGIDFKFTTTLSGEFRRERGDLKFTVGRKANYSCPTLGIENRYIEGGYIRNGVESIVKDVISGDDFKEWIEIAKSSSERMKGELDLLRSRKGKPFQFEKDLNDAVTRLEDYTERMKKELLDKEAKYQKMDSEVKAATGLSEAEEDDGILYREGDDVFTDDTSADEIVSRAKADGTYMKAPNGKPSKLTPRQWAQVRTKAFKDWFGNWEKSARIEKLRNSDSASIKGNEIEITGDYKQNKKNALEYGKSLQGEYTNADTGISVQLQRGRKNGGINEVLQHNYKDVPHILSVAAIPQIIEKSIYISSESNNDTAKNPDVVEYQHFVCGLKIGDEDYTVHSLIAVDKRGDRYYDHNLTNVEKTKLLDRINSQAGYAQGFDATSGTEPTTLNGYKGKKLEKLLQVDSSKVVDENGEPMVVYHSGAQNITTFSRDFDKKGIGRQFWGKGFYFSTSKSKDEWSKRYQSKTGKSAQIYPAFLNIKHPSYSPIKGEITDTEYDGVILRPQETVDGETDYMFVASDPTQIKSATDNVGTFERTNPDIRYREGEQNSPDTNRQRMRDEAVNMGNYLGVEVRIVEDGSKLPGKRGKAKGFFDRADNSVTVVIGNHKSIGDIQATILHEIVGHYGLRQMFGEKFDDMMDTVYRTLDKETRRKIADVALRSYRGDVRVATEEYLASIAERGVERPGVWSRVKSAIKEFFRSMGIDLRMSDEDIAYMLWKSKNRLKDGDSIPTVIDKIAKDQEMREGLLYRDGLGFGSLLHTPKADRTWVSELAHDFMEKIRNGNPFTHENYIRLREGYQDSMIRVRDFQREIERETGHKAEDFEDFYTYITQSTSRAQQTVNRFKTEYMDNIWKEIASIAEKMGKVAGEGYRSIETYMMIKHGLERNAEMRKREIDNLTKNGQNPSQNDIDKINAKDFSGLTDISEEITGNPGMDEKACEKWAADFESKYDTNALWNAINKATKATMDQMRDTGMISKETYDLVNGMYKYYVPLKEWDGKRATDLYDYVDSDQDIVSTPLKKAEGRKTRAGNILANIASDFESATMMGYKNMAKQRLLNLVRNSGTGMASVSEQWYTRGFDANGNEIWEPAAATGFTEDPEHNAQVIQDFNDNMRVLQKSGDAMLHKDVLRLGVPVKKWQEKQHTVRVKEAGRDILIYFNGDPRVAQAINGQNNVKLDNAVLRGANNLRKWMMLNYTGKNINFIPRNFIRDFFYVPTMNFVKYGAGFEARYLRNFIPALRDIAKAEFRGKNIADYEAFKRNGGMTGYVEVMGYDRYDKEIKRLIKKSEGANLRVVDMLSGLGSWLERANSVIENGARFATYRAAKQSGMSELKAIEAAKEASVNFNRRGSGQMGAVYAQNFYFFFNASIQGTQNFTSAAKNNPGRAIAAISMWATLGYMARIIGSMLSGDDDDSYDNLPDYIRQNNIVIPVPMTNKYIMFPLPVELRAVFGLGDMMGQASLGQYKGRDFAGDLALKLADLLPKSVEFPDRKRNDDETMVEAVIKNVSPDAIRPILDAYLFNENYFGKRVTGRNDYNKHVPEWQKVSYGTSKMLIEASRKLNELTGGDYATKGWADKLITNPSAMEYIFEQYLGGVGKAITQSYKTVEGLVNGDLAVRNVPVVSGLMYSTENMIPRSYINERYSNYVNEYEETSSRMRRYDDGLRKGEDLNDRFSQFMQSDEFQRYSIVDKFKKQIDGIYDMAKSLEEGSEVRNNLNGMARQLKIQMINELDKLDKDEK